MKKEYSNEVKAKILLQYTGQKCNFGYPEIQNKGTVTGYVERYGIEVFKGVGMVPYLNIDPKLITLILRPISALTDEDAIEVAKIWGQISTVENGKTAAKMFLHSVPTYQYLQSKGYDLPQHILDGQTLQQVGWAVYEKGGEGV